MCCISLVQLLSHVQLIATPWTAAHQSSLCPSPTPGAGPNSCPLSPFPMSQFFASSAKVFEFSFSISPSNEYSGLISFRMDWIDLLQSKGTSTHHNSKASILWCSAFFIVQLSYPYPSHHIHHIHHVTSHNHILYSVALKKVTESINYKGKDEWGWLY